MKTLINILILFLFSYHLFGQATLSLPRSTPEAEGVSPEGIMDFLEAVSEGEHELHSLMVLRHGKVVAEGWWDPYGPDLKRCIPLAKVLPLLP